MGDGSLSQDEIDALLQGADNMLSSPSVAPTSDIAMSEAGLSPVERDAFADIINMAMVAVAPTLSGYLGKNISITNALVEVKSADAIQADFGRKYVQVAMDFTAAAPGKSLVVFNFNDAGIISSLMMGDESGAPPPDLSEAHQSTIQEFVSQMLSSNAIQYGEKVGGSIGVGAPVLSVVNKPYELQLPGSGEMVKVSYNINIENLVNSKFYQIFELSLASMLAKSSMGGGMPAYSQPMHRQQPMQMQQPMGQIGISPVKFPPLGEGVPSGVSGNITLLMDVPMTLTVELGRTRQLVKDILGLGEGSIIELDKLAGEPVDLLVNGKLIAKGEVVVIDENFGVRVTDIVSPADRINKIHT